MAVDLIGYSKMDDQVAMQEAAAAGLRSMEQFISQLSHLQQLRDLDYKEITDFTVGRFKKVISILNRTGRARFRHGPAGGLSSTINSISQPKSVNLDFTKPTTTAMKFSITPSISSANSSFISSFSGERKPPLSSSSKKCQIHESGSRCHCSKRR